MTAQISTASKVNTPVVYGAHPNDDDKIEGIAKYIGNFHKTLCHNKFGEVFEDEYVHFEKICRHVSDNGDFERVGAGKLSDPNQADFIVRPIPTHAAKLVNPQAGRSTDVSGPDPLHIDMHPAPGVLSDSTAAEMTELYWMAILRDLSFDEWQSNAKVKTAIRELSEVFSRGVQDSNDPGKLLLGADLPVTPKGQLDLRLQTLFRAGLPDEHFGPIVSQFFLQNINYGAQLIEQTVVPYVEGRNYLQAHPNWLLAQNSGYDVHGRDYGSDNFYGDDKTAYENPCDRVYIRNMRDIARFVNRDALHQAYFNAALLLLNWGAKENVGNPYNNYVRQLGFGTLGGPNLLALVSEVATRALKVVWRQKWLVHRRLRPEAYGGLMQMQRNGYETEWRKYGLPEWVFETDAAKCVQDMENSLFLPMAYSAGSPNHPSYGAGHATVAGACVTILKAWFEDANLCELFSKLPECGKDPGAPPTILQPGRNSRTEPLKAYCEEDAKRLTIHGELNKLAANVAMGRSMGGVHWRTDNTRSLRLGERVATIMLRRILPTYAERPISLSYVNFDGNRVRINSSGAIEVEGDEPLNEFYALS